MKRFIDSYLLEWKHDKYRKSLLLRGARQVGKTHAARELGKTYPNFVEINLETNLEFRPIFELNLNPKRIVSEINSRIKNPIDPSTTLLFFDEIQAVPNALTSLRYFYEEMPELHVIGAGSLLDFTIHEIGIPVGRVESLYMYPMSFVEFLYAMGHKSAMQHMLEHTPEKPFSTIIHTMLLRMVGEYIAIGGMPEAVKRWRDTKDTFSCIKINATINETYRQDFPKYSKKFQIPYISLLFDKAPYQFGHKFKYSKISPDLRKRELEPCVFLLETAGIFHKIMHTDGNGVPLGAEADPHHFKIIFLDVALSQNLLGANLSNWIITPLDELVNKGNIVEAFVGQELLAYASPHIRPNLFYWERTARSSEAEVDYLFQQEANVIPIEVKGGTGSTLKSMHMFLESRPKSPYGIRFSIQNYSIHNKIHSYPLYAIAKAINAKVPL